MLYLKRLILSLFVLCLVILGCGSGEFNVSQLEKVIAFSEGEPKITEPPPKVIEVIRKRWEETPSRFYGDNLQGKTFDDILAFYTKYVDAGGIAIIGNSNVRDAQFYAARKALLAMTSKRPEIRANLTIEKPFYFIIFDPHLDDIIDVPDADGYPVSHCGGDDCIASIQWRTIDSDDRRRDGSLDDQFMYLYTFLHEAGHAMMSSIQKIDPTFDERLLKIFLESKAEGRPAFGGYGHTRVTEFWAEATQKFFIDPPSFNIIFNKHHEPEMFELLEEWYPRIHLGTLSNLREPVEW